MCHGAGQTVRRGDHVNLAVQLCQRLLEDDHRESAGACGDVAGADADRVRRGHAGSCVTLRRAEGNACLQSPGGIQECGAGSRQNAGSIARAEDLGQDLLRGPGELPVRDLLLELFHHAGIVLLCLRIDREHAGSVADTQHLLPGQLPVDEACKGRDKTDAVHMGLSVQDRLIEVGYGPALGNVEAEQLRQLLRCGAGDVVSPGAEGNQQLVLLIKSKVAVHHSADADGSELLQRDAVLLLHCRGKASVGVLQTFRDVFHAVGPDTVLKTVLPGVGADGKDFAVLVDQDTFDPCGAEFDSEICLAFLNAGLAIHNFPPKPVAIIYSLQRSSEARSSGRGSWYPRR